MNAGLIVIMNVAVAGFVGGITNHYAIKMLFHPREEKRIGPWRVPFTPGLIPKRKDEIGRSLGKVVAEHLVTTEGLQRLLDKPEFRLRLTERLHAFVLDWTSREETILEVLRNIWPDDQIQHWKEQTVGWAEDRMVEALRSFWLKNGMGERTLGGFVPSWNEEKREALVERAVELLIREIGRELDTLHGERMLKQMTSQLVGQAGGGFLGGLASMFLDTDKLAGKVKQALLDQLSSPSLQGFISGFIRDRLLKLEAMTLEEALRLAAPEREPVEWLGERAIQALQLGGRADRLLDKRLSEWLGPRQDWLLARVPQIVDGLTKTLAARMPRLMEAIELPVLVEEQVAKFPIEQVENIILSLSGKEFRAITWLGVLLGGVIGLIQSFILLWQR